MQEEAERFSGLLLDHLNRLLGRTHPPHLGKHLVHEHRYYLGVATRTGVSYNNQVNSQVAGCIGRTCDAHLGGATRHQERIDTSCP